MGNRPSHDLKLSPGDVVDGRYTLLELLGEGAAGKVFRAQDRGRNDMFIALKLLHAKDPRWENFFRREFQVLSRLTHPNLVRVYDFGPAPDENTYYFTQELVVGKPLLDVVAGKKVDVVAGLFIEICRALEFIHGHGVLHRDLKPANILVQKHADPGERVRVLDFGLWRELDPRPQKGARWAGTPPYLASEVLRGYGHSISADLYAVGVTLFQAVTRKLPHGRGTPPELLAARKEAAPDLSGVVADPLAKLIARLLSEEPGQRPASAAEVAAELSVLVPNHALAMPITLGRARLVGRDREREIIEGIIARVRAGDPSAPRLIVVSGADGVGKSRLVGEVKAHAQLGGGRSAIGRCLEDVQWGYRPIADLVRALASTAETADLSAKEREVVETLCPELATKVHEAPSNLPAEQQVHFQAAASDLLIGFSKSALCVLVIDDAPYCDAASAQILAQTIARAKNEKLLVVVTAGPAREAGDIPANVIEAAGRNALRLKLVPLPREEVARLVSALLGVTEVPDALTDTVMAHAGGNPLLVEELVALFIEKKQLTRGPRGWRLNEFVADTVKVPAQGALAERLARLSEEEQCALCALAVFNRPAGAKILAAISGLEPDEVQEALSSSEAAGLVKVVGEEDGRARVVFRHRQIRDALIKELAQGGVLAEWHLNTAEVLEERAGDDNAGLISGTMAFHYAAAEEPERALWWGKRAAEYALKTFAFNDAIAFARRASRLVNADRPQDKADIDVVMGRALYQSGAIAEARAFLEGVIAKTKASAVSASYGEMHVWLARCCLQLGVQAAGKSAIDRALTQLKPDVHPIGTARLLIARGELLVLESPTKSKRDAERALKLFKKSKRSVFDELSCFTILYGANLASGDIDKAVEFAKRRKRVAEKHSLTLERITAGRLLAEALSRRGDRLGARNLLNEANALARSSGYRIEQALIGKALGYQLYISGAYSEAISRLQQAATLCAEMGQMQDRAGALCMQGMCYTAKGEYERGLDHLRAAVSAFDKAGQLQSLVTSRCALAEAFLAKGLLDEAEGMLKDAAARLPEGAALTQAQAEVFAVQGSLFTARGHFDKARVAFLNALVRFRRAHDQFALGRALTGYAQLLLRFKKTRRAYRLAKRAEWIFSDLDARGEMKRIAPLVNATAGLSGVKQKAGRAGR